MGHVFFWARFDKPYAVRVSVLTVVPTEDANSAAGRATLEHIRAAAPTGVTVGGEAAQSADFLDAVYGNFPRAARSEGPRDDGVAGVSRSATSVAL